MLECNGAAVSLIWIENGRVDAYPPRVPSKCPVARRLWRVSAWLSLVAVLLAVFSFLPIPLLASETPVPATDSALARLDSGAARFPVVSPAALCGHGGPGDASACWACVELLEDERSLEPELSGAPGVQPATPAVGLTGAVAYRMLHWSSLHVPPAPHSARALARSVSLLS
jgi:hypothetical protein